MPSANRRLKRSVRSTADGRRVALYIRYSSRMQEDGWSLEAQRRILEAYCAERGWEVVAVFSDEAKSAKDDHRPGFQDMMAFVRAGKADRILVHKLDRFVRHLRILLAYVEELDRRGVALVCAAQPIDTGDPMTGKLVLVILGVLAEMYLVALSEETIKGKRERAEQGLWLGMLPWGYHVPEGDPHAVPALDPAKAALWRAAADLYDPLPPRPRPEGRAEARTWGEVAAFLNARGARMRSRWQGKARWRDRNPDGLMLDDTVAEMLQNLFYAGVVVYDDPDTGEQLVFEGKHAAVTDRAQIERIRAKSRRRLSLHTRPQDTPRLYTANGIVRCAGCRHPLNIAHSPGGARYACLARRRGAVCPARKHSIKVDELDALLDGLIARLDLPPTWRRDIVDAMRRDSSTAQRQRRRADLHARLGRVHERHEAGGFASKEAYRARVAELRAEIESLGAVDDGDVLDAGDVIASVMALWSLPADVPIADAQPRDDATRARLNEHIGERRAFLQMAFDTVEVDLDRGRLVTAALRPAFQPLAQLFPSGIPPPVSGRTPPAWRTTNR
jgi:DNA invertase Pin-like site-specific DNA recombinase